MKASHNTFSYLKSSWFMELFSPLWRCQSLPAERQYVEVCDIRVRYRKGKWHLCHGLACFGPKFNTLRNLIDWCMSFGFKSFRLMYETRDKGYTQFFKEWRGLPQSIYNNCICAIYNPYWLFLKGNNESLVEHNKHMWYNNEGLWFNLKNFFSSTIKSYARENNVSVDDDRIHMYDYIQFMKYE